MYLAKLANLAAIVFLLLALFPRSQAEPLSISSVRAKLAQQANTKPFMKRLERDLAYALPGISSYGFWMVCLLGSACGIWVGYVFNNFFVGLIAGAGGIYAPSKFLRALVSRKQKIVDRQLEPTLTQIANLYKITQSIEQSFRECTKVLAPPLRDEFERFITDLDRAGMPLAEALARLDQRLDNPDFRFFANLAIIAQKYGGDTKELLHLVPQTLRERQLSRMALETEVAGAKQQAWLLFGGTPLFLVFFYFARPDFVSILTETTLGKLGMATVAFLSILSIVLIEKITEPVY